MTERLVELVIHYAGWLNKEVIVFVISMMPILELRGGVLAGYWMNLPLLTTSVIALVGNLLPIPYILFFIEAILKFLEKHNILTKFIHKIRDRALHKSKAIQNAEFIGLVLLWASHCLGRAHGQALWSRKPYRWSVRKPF